MLGPGACESCLIPGGDFGMVLFGSELSQPTNAARPRPSARPHSLRISGSFSRRLEVGKPLRTTAEAGPEDQGIILGRPGVGRQGSSVPGVPDHFGGAAGSVTGVPSPAAGEEGPGWPAPPPG